MVKLPAILAGGPLLRAFRGFNSVTISAKEGASFVSIKR